MHRIGQFRPRHFFKAALAAGAAALGGCAHVPRPATTPQDYIQVDGHSFYRIDKGQGTPVVILHGLPDHSRNQQRLIEPLSQRHRVFAYDRLGLGLSDKPSTRHYDINEQVGDLEAVIKAIPLNRPALIGHSIGGSVALHYAAEHPNDISQLVLVNPVILFEPGHTGMRGDGSFLLRLPLVADVLISFAYRGFIATQLKSTFFDENKVTEQMIDSYYFPFEESGTGRHLLATWRSMDALGTSTFLDDADRIKKAGVPVLLLWTSNDPEMPASDGPDLAKRLGATLVRVNNSGHVPQLELDDAHLQSDVIAPIDAFLK